MSTGRKAVIGAVGTLALAAIVWSFVVPRELKNLYRFGSWRAAHVRTSGFVERPPAGTRIFWEEFGSPGGPPVVVLHGGLCTTTVMVGVIEPLVAASHRVIAIESRGHGESTDTATVPTYEAMSDDVIGVMDALRVDRAAVVGWSDGGNVGLDLARRYGPRIASVIAFGSNHTPAPDGNDLADVAMFKEAKADSALFWPLRRLYEKSAPDPAKWPELFAREKQLAFTQPNWSLAQLGEIKVPVLLVNGEHDIVLLPYATEMKNAIPGARLEVVAGETHMLPVANPEAVKPLMLAFLTR